MAATSRSVRTWGVGMEFTGDFTAPDGSELALDDYDVVVVDGGKPPHVHAQ